MTPTQKDIQRLQESIPKFRHLRHNLLYNQGLSPKTKQGLNKQLYALKSRITTLISNINSRFFNSKILEVTYLDEINNQKYRVYITDVTEKDIRDYFTILEYFQGLKYSILEIREIQDRINPLPL